MNIIHGDCLEELKKLEDNSVDAVITDPPYGLSNTKPQQVADVLKAWVTGDTVSVPAKRGGFMGADWDSFVPPPAVWEECMRVLKPGGHMAVFAGARTQDLMGLSIRLAGFEIRDGLSWIYGSGFPSGSLDVGKSVKKVGDESYKDWEGWGTVLKPGNEPVLLAKKPSAGSVARNVIDHGVGALNIGASRVGDEVRFNGPAKAKKGTFNSSFDAEYEGREVAGRWPSNVLLDEFSIEEIRRQGGDDAVNYFHAFKYASRASQRERPVIECEDGSKIQHSTVKPLALMEWLVTLITPPGGTVLDPFAGSGTTLQAALNKGFQPIGIEQDADYIKLIEKRLEATCTTHKN